MRRALDARPAARAGAAKRPAAEAGYALLMAMFIGALMIVGAAVAIPNLITQDRRQKEALMIWRGRQYARAIGLFYRKTGRFPHNLEELEKGVGDVHFLRKAYMDPMNTEDGSWRLIYLGPGGQLIGSLCWQTMAQYQAAVMGVAVQGMGLSGAPGAPPLAAAFGGAGSAGFAFRAATSAATSGNPGAAGAAAMAAAPTCGSQMIRAAAQSEGFAGSPQAGATVTAPQSAASAVPEPPGGFGSSQPKPPIIEEGQMVGGNLIGVASKVKQKSLKVYLGGTTYRQWEFLWNPLQGRTSGVAFPGTTPPTGQQPHSPYSRWPFGLPEPPGAAIPPGPGLPSSNPPPAPGPG